MTAFIAWYILITLVGWLTFPLAYRLFPVLADRGYSLSRAFGLLIWGYVFWLFASLGLAQNDVGGLLLALLILAGLSAWAYFKPPASDNHSIVGWLKDHSRLILTTEILFLLAFGFLAFIRSANPEIVATEKPMELMFINGILNSPTFPPRDLWLSGYSISYYYFGYVMASMLAMFTGTSATIAFNLMVSLIFGLGAVGAYGILYNLLITFHFPLSSNQSSTLAPHASAGVVNRKTSIFGSLLAPLFLLIISNVEGFLEVLHRRGLFWQFGADGSATSRFWTWLDIPELRDPPAQPLGWIPERYLWWWRASRVVQDYDLNGTFREAIDEFPFFSYLLADLHPHVLATPFLLLAIAVALNLFLGGWRGTIDLYFGELRIDKTGFFTVALVLGGLAFLNTWDILIAGVLIVFSYALAQVQETGWGWERIEDILLLGIPVAITAFVMYLPFYIGFDSQAGGPTPNFMYPTRGAQLWVMWGTIFIPLFAYLIVLSRNKTPAHWRAGIVTALGIVLALLAVMFLIGFLALRVRPELVMSILEGQGMNVNTFIAESMKLRLRYIGSLLTLLALLIPTLSFLFGHRSESPESQFNLHPSAFILLLIALATLLILGIDFVYLRDQFGYRINSVFKFYYEAWILLSIAAAYGTIVLLRNLRGAANVLFCLLFTLVLIVGLTYPALGLFKKTNNFSPPFGFTLDDFDRVQRENPDEAAAMIWLRSAPDGIIAEAIGGSYTAYGRISIYTGLPTVLGWPGHEGQWRDRSLQGTREADIKTLYSARDWITTQDIINRYNIRYIFIGNLERSTYQVNEEKFNRFLKLVFQQGNVTIYEVP